MDVYGNTGVVSDFFFHAGGNTDSLETSKTETRQ